MASVRMTRECFPTMDEMANTFDVSRLIPHQVPTKGSKMTSWFGTRPAAQGTLVLAVILVGCLCAASEAAKTRGVITKLTFDPEAERIELFEGIESEALSVKMVAKSSLGGHLLMENKTDQPLTVEMPESIVGVHVLGQFDSDTGGSGGGGGGQSTGGGAGGGGGLGSGGLGGGGAGQGFFSIPPEKTVLVPYKAVCLEHGKPEPRPSMTYKLVKTEEFTQDPALQELLKLVARKQIPSSVAQAAAWHLSNEMSWEELSRLKYDRIGVPDTPQFTYRQLLAAQSLVSTARGMAKERDETPEVDTPVRPRTSRVGTSR